MTCAWREANVERPAPSTPEEPVPGSSKGSPRKPEPRSGRLCARISLFLPALALLSGVLGLFAAAPSAAQTKTFSITERARATEGDSAFLTITLSEDAPGAGVAFTVAAGFGGSSTAEVADVSFFDSRVTVPGGTRTLNIAIPLTDDDMDEDEETFAVTIATSAEGWMRERDGRDTAVVAIADDDHAGVDITGVIAQDLNQLPLHLNTSSTYRVVLTSRPVADVTIKTSALLGVTVSPGSHTFSASSENDWRLPKEFTVTSARTGARAITHSLISADPKYGSLGSADWDPSSRLQFYVDPALPTRLTLRSDLVPTEGGGMVTVTATLNHPAPRGGTTVMLTPSGTAAGEGTDYTLSSTTIRIGSTQTTGTTTITVTDDSADDNGETIVLAASSRNPELNSNRLTLTIEDNDQTQQQRTGGRSYVSLIAQMQEWRNDPQWRMYRSHTSRWDRALLAFGEPVSDSSLTAMTAAEAQAFADRGWTRWVEVAQALREIEGGVQVPALPSVTIAAGAAVTEGASASFTLTAAPAPASDLDVTVSVGQEGAFVHSSALGARTVTIPAGGTSATLELLTMDDGTDEPDGAIAATLAGGAGYTLGDAARATVTVTDNDEDKNPGLVTKRAIAREGTDEAVAFTIRLDRPASHRVTVDWATADGADAWAGTAPATAGADYTASSGTLTFAPGETWKTVAVPILDDAVDEGMEHFLLRFSNPVGATLAARYRETQGLIRNDDHLQSTWLSRFGRTAGSQVADAVSERLSGGLSPGAHATLAGRPLDLAGAEDGTVLTDAMTALALALGAREAPPEGAEGPLARHDAEGPSLRNAPAATIAARSATGREILRGSSFHVSRGAGLSAWGRVAHGRFDGVQADGTGRTRLDGEVTTGILGVDAEWKRLLAGVAVSLSEGEGRFESPGADVGASGDVESTMTTVSPYARVSLSGRVTAWGLAGRGTGGMTLRFDDGSMAPVRTDLSMRLGAIGARGALLEQDASGGMDLALKADALFVRTESEAVANSVATGTDASRVRLVLEAGRAFGMGGGATLRPSLELGLRRDGGDAETGTGVEIGGGLAWSDPSSRVTAALRARALAAHAASGYGEWGVSGTLRIEPDRRGRGLSLSLASGVGAEAGGADAVWSARNAAALVPGAASDPSARLDAEVGYGLPAAGGRFTGTPYAGLSATDAEQGARVGWRLTRPSDPEAFRLDVEAGRREASGGDERGTGIGFRITSRW